METLGKMPAKLATTSAHSLNVSRCTFRQVEKTSDDVMLLKQAAFISLKGYSPNQEPLNIIASACSNLEIT